MSYHVYGLMDPNTKELRYVGETNNMRFRFNSHLCGSRRNPKYHSQFWIRSLLRKAQKPEMIELESYETEKEALDAEVDLIAYYKFIGCNLTNHTKGGETPKTRSGKDHPFYGKHHSERSRAKISKALNGNQNLKGFTFSEESKKRMSDSHKGMKNHLGFRHTQETKNKIGEYHRNKTWKLIDGKRVWLNV